MDYMTRFPEAIPLPLVMVPKVATKLIKWVARVGILKEIVTKEGMNFMLGVLQGFCGLDLAHQAPY